MVSSLSELIAALAEGRVAGRILAADGECGFAELGLRARGEAEKLAGLAGKRLLLEAGPTIGFVARLLACWQAGVLPLVADGWLTRDRDWVASLGLAGTWDESGLTALGEGRSAQPAGLVLFTSGSSGRPKGVRMGEGGLLGQLEAVAQSMDLSAPASVAVILPLHHSFALITQVLLTLRQGGELHLLPGAWLPGQRLEYLAQQGIERLAGVPTHFRLLLEPGVSLPALRHLTVAGAALDAALAAQMLAACPQGALWVGYGLTEAGPRVSALPHRHPAFAAGSAGRAIPGVEIAIEADEILVRSDYAMLGYLDDAAATAAVMADGWLRTGDTGYLEDDCLYVTGRRDELLNIAGEKVAPAAIEQVLLACEGVEAAAVYGEADDILGQRLVALIQGEVALNALRRHVRAQLPPEKRPRSWYAVSSLPLTSNGKLKRKELPQWPKTILTPGS